jgi:hypothetical protein
MKSPILIAKKFYEEKRAEAAKHGEKRRSFEEELQYYFRNGIVRSTTKCFVMARMIDLANLGAAWFCSCGVGDLEDMIAGMPFELPFICFPRRGQDELRIYRTDRFCQLIRRPAKISEPIGASVGECGAEPSSKFEI